MQGDTYPQRFVPFQFVPFVSITGRDMARFQVTFTQGRDFSTRFWMSSNMKIGLAQNYLQSLQKSFTASLKNEYLYIKIYINQNSVIEIISKI